MNRKNPPDQKIRNRIATEFNKSFFVEAGAGSGKTHSLVDRMSGLIRYGHTKIENIAAVTFTRKAAAELREKFQIDLENILHDKNTKESEKDVIIEALLNFERSLVSTIHSFCARLLRERPVEAGIDPGFEEIEEEEDIIFAGEVWAEYIEKQGFENNKLIGWMQENGISPDAIKDIYIKLVRFPDVEVFRQDLKQPDFSEAKKEVEKFIRAMRKKMPDAEPANGWDALQTTVRRCLKLFSLEYLGEDRLFVELLKILDKNINVTQNRWPDRNVAKACEEEAVKFQEDVVKPALRAWSEYLHKPLIDFAMGGVDYYDKWRKERSALNFQDLLMRTARLLRENAEVRAYFKKRLTYLLVDEFQDTDPIQAEIVMLLTGKDNSVNNWRKVKPRPGALFLVGDPKQSIYRFRRADIDIYNQVKGIFNSGAGEVLELTSNFRSLEPIRDLTNAVFKDIFPVGDTKHQAKFAPLVTVREKSEKYLNGVFENRIPKVYRNLAEAAASIDTGIIANWIYQSINGGLKLERTESEKQADEIDDAKPGDFMIIAKRKLMLPLYARALEALGVPYEISGGENFSQSEELYEIYKVLKATADPKDPVAIVAALRGLFFGVSDNDLYNFAREGGRFSYFSEQEKRPTIIKEAFVRLREYNEIAMHDTPVTAIEKIIEKLGIIPLAMSEEMGSSKAGNIFKAIELLRGQKPDNTGSFAELVDYLKDVREISSIEEMSLFPGTAKAVRIMNLHKAKGLEAPVVILVDPAAKQRDFEPQHHITRTSKESVGYFTVNKQRGEHGFETVALPSGWEEYATEEKLYEDAEKKRLDYVAATRAKNILVISTYREGSTIKAWESFFPYLASMPKLPVKETSEIKKKKTLELKEKGWESERAKLEMNVEKIRVASYHMSRVTDIVEKPDIFAGEPVGGMRWGRVVHEALELCGKGKRDKLEIIAGNLLKENKIPEIEQEKMVKTIDDVMKSDIWKRMSASKEKYFEVPLSSMKDNSVVTGVVDMVFKEDDGWVIVDYKTDDFDVNPKKKSAYQHQIDLYAELWGEITGEKIKEKLLYKV